MEKFVQQHIKEIVEEYGLSESEFNVQDVRLYGSYSTAQNKDTSDLDVLVQYSGSFREDDMFNIFHEEPMTFSDKNGKEVVVDINPINVDKSGTIDEKLSEMDMYFQSERIQNNAVDLTNDFEKTPTIQEVKDYINEIIESGTKFATLSPEWFVDIKGGAKKKDHIIKSSNFKNMNKAEKNRHNKYIMSLEKLLANAEYVGEKENTKKNKKPNIEKYHYFKTTAKIGDKVYEIIFDTEEYVNDKSSSSANVLRSVKNLDEDTNSITNSNSNFNPKTVHLYNIKEVKGKPLTYFQSAMVAGVNPEQKVDVVDLSAQFPNDSKLSKKELTTYIKSLIGTALSSSDKKAILNFVKTSKRSGKRNVYIPNHIANSSKIENLFKDERNAVVKNITDLIKESVLIDLEPNNKKTTKPDVDNYLRFYVPARINNDIYTIRISAENNSSKNLFNVLNADVYDLIIDKKTTVSSPSTKGNFVKQPSNDSITDNSKNFNPEQITIKEMLKDVQGADGIMYYQEDNNSTTDDNGVDRNLSDKILRDAIRNNKKVSRLFCI